MLDYKFLHCPSFTYDYVRQGKFQYRVPSKETFPIGSKPPSDLKAGTAYYPELGGVWGPVEQMSPAAFHDDTILTPSLDPFMCDLCGIAQTEMCDNYLCGHSHCGCHTHTSFTLNQQATVTMRDANEKISIAHLLHYDESKVRYTYPFSIQEPSPSVNDTATTGTHATTNPSADTGTWTSGNGPRGRGYYLIPQHDCLFCVVQSAVRCNQLYQVCKTGQSKPLTVEDMKATTDEFGSRAPHKERDTASNITSALVDGNIDDADAITTTFPGSETVGDDGDSAAFAANADTDSTTITSDNLIGNIHALLQDFTKTHRPN
jgi:hypothetical protein